MIKIIKESDINDRAIRDHDIKIIGTDVKSLIEKYLKDRWYNIPDVDIYASGYNNQVTAEFTVDKNYITDFGSTAKFKKYLSTALNPKEIKVSRFKHPRLTNNHVEITVILSF